MSVSNTWKHVTEGKQISSGTFKRYHQQITHLKIIRVNWIWHKITIKGGYVIQLNDQNLNLSSIKKFLKIRTFSQAYWYKDTFCLDEIQIKSQFFFNLIHEKVTLILSYMNIADFFLSEIRRQSNFS